MNYHVTDQCLWLRLLGMDFIRQYNRCLYHSKPLEIKHKDIYDKKLDRWLDFSLCNITYKILYYRGPKLVSQRRALALWGARLYRYNAECCIHYNWGQALSFLSFCDDFHGTCTSNVKSSFCHELLSLHRELNDVSPLSCSLISND